MVISDTTVFTDRNKIRRIQDNRFRMMRQSNVVDAMLVFLRIRRRRIWLGRVTICGGK